MPSSSCGEPGGILDWGAFRPPAVPCGVKRPASTSGAPVFTESFALPMPNREGGRWDSNPRPSEPQVSGRASAGARRGALARRRMSRRGRSAVRLQYDPREGERGYALSSRAVLPLEHSHECGRERNVVRTFNPDAIISPPSPLPRRTRTARALGGHVVPFPRTSGALLTALRLQKPINPYQLCRDLIEGHFGHLDANQC